MPELPEVETIRRGLIPHVLNRRIMHIDVFQSRLRYPVPCLQSLHLEKIENIHRRAKYLLFQTKSGDILAHLGMSGHFRVVEKKSFMTRRPHDHVIFHLDGDYLLIYHDPRRFGLIDFLPAQTRNQDVRIASLGPEPFDEESLTSQYLFLRAQRYKTYIKSFLLDQKIVAGLGNIYVAESLFESAISPLSRASNLNKNQWNQIIIAMKKVLAHAIAAGGSSIDDFRHTDGSQGYFQHQFKVYGREGQPCFKCRNVLQGVRIAGRSTVFCAQCQKDVSFR